MKLTIEINGGNDAVQTSDDFADILEAATYMLQEENLIEAVQSPRSLSHVSPFRKPLKDINGATVGYLLIEK